MGAIGHPIYINSSHCCRDTKTSTTQIRRYGNLKNKMNIFEREPLAYLIFEQEEVNLDHRGEAL